MLLDGVDNWPVGGGKINILTPMACTVIENQQRNQGNTEIITL